MTHRPLFSRLELGVEVALILAILVILAVVVS
jgi:hypothetical protein